MTDLVERLRKRDYAIDSPLQCEAADEIERLRAEVRDWQENYKQAMDGRVALRAENAKLREALEWFADDANYRDTRLAASAVALKGRKRARAALQKDEGE